MAIRIKLLSVVLPATGASTMSSAMVAGHPLFPATQWGDVVNGGIIGILAGIAVAALIRARIGPIR
ncbi:hypothetical protein KY084_15060 [Stakelama sp. CBK3Z-3]|uniref:Uncharacterized protein n=1 Tax=Stakelama flava TaxID=2860338 RepID=A0ABS6XPN6_9SPHN|nr:hypothetical protein [Stakelama flava]MBW4332180.1 hypothetical protein [Stakelama flava]